MKRPEGEQPAEQPADKKGKTFVPDFRNLDSWHTFVVADLEFRCKGNVTLYANASHLTHIPYFRNMFAECKRESPRMIIDISNDHPLAMLGLLYQAYGFPKHAARIICHNMKCNQAVVIDETLSFFNKIIYDPAVQLVYDAINLLPWCPESILPVLIKHSNYGKSLAFVAGDVCFEKAFLKRMESLIINNVPVVLNSVATEELIKYYMSLECSNRLTKLSILLAMGAENLANVLTAEYLTRHSVAELVNFMHANRVFEHPKLCEIFVSALHTSNIPNEFGGNSSRKLHKF